LPYAVYCFFNEGGTRCYVVNLDCPAKAIAYPEHSDSFSVRKKVDGTGADEALKAKVSDVNDEVYTFKLIVSEVESKSEVDNLDINFEELKVGQFSSEDGIKPSAESVELQKTTDGSPLPVENTLLLEGGEGGEGEEEKAIFTGRKPSVFVRRKSLTNKEPLSVKLEKSENEGSDNGSGYTLTVKKGEKPESAPVELQVGQEGDNDFIDLEDKSENPIDLQVQYQFIFGTTPQVSKEEDFVELPTIMSCEDLNPVLENLKKVDDINIIVFPDMGEGSDEDAEPYLKLGYEYCYEREYCFFIIDPPQDKNTLTDIKTFVSKIGKLPVNIDEQQKDVESEKLNKYSAVYFPWLYITNPMYSPYSDPRKTILVPPSGAIAGIYARTDANRGVWKAPAGLSDGRIFSAKDVELKFSEKDYGDLNCHNINAIRNIKDTGVCAWGARTVALFTAPTDPCDAIIQTEWKYINVRRLFNYIEESLYEGNQWVVFEPNGPELWSLVNRNITAFLTEEWKAGAFYGATAEEAFFVKVDKDNNPPDLREQGLLIIDVGIAPIYPAEFVIIRITQKMQTE